VETAITSPVAHRQAAPLFSRLRTAAGQADPFPIYRQLRAMGEVVAAPWGGHVVTSYDLCDRVLRNRQDFLEPDSGWRARQGEATRWTAASSREIGRTLPALNGEKHTRARRSAGGMFDRSTLETLLGPVSSITERLLDKLAERLAGGEADLHAVVSEELPVATIGHWFRLPTADFALLRDLTHKMAFPQELLPSASQLAEADEAVMMLQVYFRELVADRRRQPGDDPVSHWLATWDRIEPSHEAADENAYDLALIVLLGALETTAALLSQLVLRLLEHPDQWDWLTHHPEDVPGAVEEALRYDPAIHVATRVARADTEIAGVAVRADDLVHLMVAAANRDPGRYDDPDTFTLHRQMPAHLSFGSGIHYCLGAPLARFEAQTLLRGLLQRFPHLTLARRPQWHPRVVFRRPRNLHVALF
jgi:cytochrome P450